MASIVLIGFMGVGKTTLGRELANRIGRDFVDLDEAVEVDAGKSISQIFAEDGEEAFRLREAIQLSRILEAPDKVVATGGGAPSREGAMLKMLQAGTVIWLRASVDTIVSRTTHDSNRPLLEGLSRQQKREKIEEMLAKREDYYVQANFAVDTDGHDPGWLVERICERILDSERSK